MFLPKAMLFQKQQEWANFNVHALFKRTRVMFAKVLSAEASGTANRTRRGAEIHSTSPWEGKNLWPFFLQSSKLPFQTLPGEILTTTK